jgi:thymidylate kinase
MPAEWVVNREAAGPLVLEFVGLPGAGKSAVAELLGAALAQRGISWGGRKDVGGQKVRRSNHYAGLALYYLRHPAELQAALQLGQGGSSRIWARVYQAVKYVSVWSYRLALARRSGCQVLILDQGPVQDAWSLLLRGPWRDEMVQEAVSRVIRTSGLSYALVYFDLPVEVAVRRIAQRPTRESRFDRLEPPESARQLTREGKRLEQLYARVVETTGTPQFRLTATQPLEQSCAELEGFIAAIQRGVPRAKVFQSQ